LNDGTGRFTDATYTRMPPMGWRTNALVLADVDSDGDLDLLVGNQSSQNQLFLNDGTGTFRDATAAQMPAIADDTRGLAVGDVDGDGDADLVVGNLGQSRLLLNDGAGTFVDTTATCFPAGALSTTYVALRDLDGDGDLDVIGGSWLLRNDGNGRFTDVTAAMGLTGFVRFAEDLDGDGDVDLIGDQPHFNLLRQLDAPFLLRPGCWYRLDAYARHGAPRLFDVAQPYLALGTANVELPQVGRLGIDPAGAAVLPPLLIPQPTGMASLSIAVPNNPVLAGIPIHAQAVLVQYPLQARFTNVITEWVLR
jgi:hypothetical protein